MSEYKHKREIDKDILHMNYFMLCGIGFILGFVVGGIIALNTNLGGWLFSL